MPYALLAAATAAIVMSGLAQRVDGLLYDGLIAFDRAPLHEDIAIVGIDEASLAQLGRWPWPRATHARLLDRLRDVRARAVAMQVIFAEPSEREADRALAEAVARHGRVVLPVFPEAVGAAVSIHADGAGPIRASMPLAELVAVAQLGHVDTDLDDDGIARSVYLKAGVEGEGQPPQRWSHLALAVVEVGGMLDRRVASRLLRGERREQNKGARDTSHERVSTRWVRDMRTLVPFASDPFPMFSYAEVLTRPEVAAGLRGKLVLVGMTAQGFGDSLATPLLRAGAPMPGVEFNAHVTNALLNGRLVLPLALLPTLLLSMALPLAVYATAQRAPRRWVPWVAPLAAMALLLLVVGLLRWVDLWFAPAGALVGVLLSYPVSVWHSSRRDARLLAIEKTRLDATLQSIGDAVVTTDIDGRVSFMNPAAEALLGVSLASVSGRRLDTIVSFEDDHGKMRYPAREVLVPLAQAEFAAGVHGRLTVRPGYTRVARISGRPVRTSPGVEASGVVLALTDLSDLAAMTARMEHQATHDALTDLPNRALLRDRLTQALARARRVSPGAVMIAVLFVDLDHFKQVNDQLGHAEGDLVLREVGQRLRGAVRAADTVARWGGDEFVVVLDGLASRAAAEERACALADALRVPGLVRNGEQNVCASVGVALYPQDGDDADTLLRHADAAMYDAKQSGRDALIFYRAHMHGVADERARLEEELRAALSRQELTFVYQPQVRLDTGAIVGVQALLRWQHPRAGVLPPHHFMEIAEATGLVYEIGTWSVREACRVLHTWQAGGLPPVSISVNVSPRQLAHQQFDAGVIDALDREGIREDALMLEISESVMSTDMERAAVVLGRLRKRGVKVALYDYGVGYSSLRYLKRFPVSALKVDPLFVGVATATPQDAAIIEAMVALARGLGFDLIAEGIDTEAQREFLLGCGCMLGQGNYFCAPLPLVDVTRLIAAGRSLSRF